jgi:hypothetical protein
MIARLAETLGMPLRERNMLLMAAGQIVHEHHSYPIED